MRKRIEFWHDSAPSLAPVDSYSCEPELYAKQEIVPDDAWEEYKAARLVYEEAIKKMVSRVLPAEPLDEEEISALKAECLKLVSDEDAAFRESWQRDLGMSVLALEVYGEEFVKQYGLPWEEWKAVVAERRKNEDKTLRNTTLEEAGPSSFANLEVPDNLTEVIEASKDENPPSGRRKS